MIIKLVDYFENDIDLYYASVFDVYKDSHNSGGSGWIIVWTFDWLGSLSAAGPWRPWGR